jgi:hypothetical protein
MRDMSSSMELLIHLIIYQVISLFQSHTWIALATHTIINSFYVAIWREGGGGGGLDYRHVNKMLSLNVVFQGQTKVGKLKKKKKKESIWNERLFKLSEKNDTIAYFIKDAVSTKTIINGEFINIWKKYAATLKIHIAASH